MDPRQADGRRLMGAKSHIQWTDSTFNPWEGCQKVGPGCDNCYAETRNARYGGGTAANWGPGAPRRRTSTSTWRAPRRWQREAEAFAARHGRRQRVFCASLADWADNAVDPTWRHDLAALILATPDLEWQLLTKRIGNAEGMLAEMFPDGIPANVWLGITVVNQAEADRDIPKLAELKARLGIRIAFLSIEPMLGLIDLTRHLGSIDWVIAGGESGGRARPVHVDWLRALRDACAAAGVPFFFKQWGENAVVYDRDIEDPDWRRCAEVERKTPKGRWLNLAAGHGFHGDRVLRVDRIGKEKAGRMLDGVQHDAFPA